MILKDKILKLFEAYEDFAEDPIKSKLTTDLANRAKEVGGAVVQPGAGGAAGKTGKQFDFRSGQALNKRLNPTGKRVDNENDIPKATQQWMSYLDPDSRQYKKLDKMLKSGDKQQVDMATVVAMNGFASLDPKDKTQKFLIQRGHNEYDIEDIRRKAAEDPDLQP